MTGTVIKHTAARLLALTGATAAIVVGGLLAAGPASASVPEGWPATDPVDGWHVLGVLIGIPILLFLVIAVFVYAPSLARGERVAPGATGPEDQWLGGRRTSGEIAFTKAEAGAAETDAAETDGGAGARW